MYIYNPEKGAEIRDIWIYNQLYFSIKEHESFKVGDVINIEDKVGKFLQETYGFLEEVTAIRAKNIIDARGVEKFICDHEGCGFEAKSKIGLIAHKRTHADVVDGVRVIRPQDAEEKVEKKVDSLQSAIEEETKASGLIGEGLTVE